MILAIDQGTTGSTCIVFDERAEPVGRAYREFKQHFPRPGWVEHDAAEIWDVTQAVAGEALADAEVRPGELIAVGITNQRETVCVWDPATGEPLHRAIVWQDRRTAERCAELREQGHEPQVRERTGLVLDPYFSGTKIEWLLRNVEGLRERAERGRAVFGTIDAWLAFKLTGEHVTDPSNASRTMLYNITEARWDPDLLTLLDIPERALPSVVASAGEVAGVGKAASTGEAAGAGEVALTRPEALHGHAVPLAGIAGDQQAALFGQGCTDPGMGKNTYGTGSFALMNAGFVAPVPASGLLSTVAWGIGGGAGGGRVMAGGESASIEGDAAGSTDAAGSEGDEAAARPALTYALEASIFVTGAAVQWLRDGLGVIERAQDTEKLAASLAGNEGVYFVPALTGLGSPHWDPQARGTIVGLTRGSTRAHLARATLEAIAYQTVDALAAMAPLSAEPLRELRADGGATANAWLMQFQADVLGVPVVVPEIAETTALGAAYMAGVGVGAWTVSDVREGWREGARYEPSMGVDERGTLLAGWADALKRARAH